jgi:hypothetical protein
LFEEVAGLIHPLAATAKDGSKPPMLPAKLIGRGALLVRFRYVERPHAQSHDSSIGRGLVDDRPATRSDTQIDPKYQVFLNIFPSHRTSFSYPQGDY